MTRQQGVLLRGNQLLVLRNAWVFVFVLIVASSCSRSYMDEHADDGAEYKKAMANLIRKSDRIIATEHSDEIDLWDLESSKSEIESELIYGRQELTPQQRAFFLETIEALDPKTQDAFTSCVPAVHHSFYFYSRETLLDTVDICFECSDVSWNGTQALPPWAVYSGLAKVVEHVGFSPERDWPAVARQHLENSKSNDLSKPLPGEG